MLLLALFIFPTSAEEFSSLEERMSAAEFRASGLEKLSAEELAALNAWLRGQRSLTPTTTGTTRTAAVASPQSVAETDRRGLRSGVRHDDVIESRIPGNFRGWNGTKSTFELENGMVWQSTDPAAKLSVNLQNPVVRITPGFMDAWFLQVEGYNAKIRVRRLK